MQKNISDIRNSRDNSCPITFTLLTACKNEEKDILLSIESSLAQTYPHKEIIFVDDSDDGTKEIIKKYTRSGVKLINGNGQGCCMARNLGMESASGDVIVFLTADTKLDPNYLEKILPYYQDGYDWVMVGSYSYNDENIYSRFVELSHRLNDKQPGFDPFTTQGYSVRRDAALAVGLISGGVYPFNTCRDWSLGKKLAEAGFKKIYDRSIIVPHKSPDNFPEFWLVQKTRGLMSAYQPYYMFNKTISYLCSKFIVKDILVFLQFLSIVPIIIHVAALSRCSDYPLRNFLPMLYTYSIHAIAVCFGEWQGLFNIIRRIVYDHHLHNQ